MKYLIVFVNETAVIVFVVVPAVFTLSNFRVNFVTPELISWRLSQIFRMSLPKTDIHLLFKRALLRQVIVTKNNLIKYETNWSIYQHA